MSPKKSKTHKKKQEIMPKNTHTKEKRVCVGGYSNSHPPFPLPLPPPLPHLHRLPQLQFLKKTYTRSRSHQPRSAELQSKVTPGRGTGGKQKARHTHETHKNIPGNNFDPKIRKYLKTETTGGGGERGKQQQVSSYGPRQYRSAPLGKRLSTKNHAGR